MKKLIFGAVALGVAAVYASQRPVAASVTQPCLGSGSAAEYVVTALRRQMWGPDSAAAIAMGFPYKAANVALVTDSAICAQVLASFNALYLPGDSLKFLHPAYIAKAWPPTAYALYAIAEAPYHSEMFYFDSAFAYKARMTIARETTATSAAFAPAPAH
jgi:hypothetical protein